jgi:Cu+-exporting ATPase
MIKYEYTIEGMGCMGCKRTVEGAISLVPGVVTVEADISDGTAYVEVDPALFTHDAVRAAVSEAGYTLVGLRA